MPRIGPQGVFFRLERWRRLLDGAMSFRELRFSSAAVAAVVCAVEAATDCGSATSVLTEPVGVSSRGSSSVESVSTSLPRLSSAVQVVEVTASTAVGDSTVADCVALSQISSAVDCG